MWRRTVILLLGLAALLGVPLAMSPRRQAAAGDALKLIVITPHNEQIRSEFSAAFDAWHERNFGRRVAIEWSTPGGTSEIVRMLQAQYAAALHNQQDPGGNADLVFGGGSYEHGQLARPISVSVGGQTRSTTISVPVDFSQDWLDQIYGPNQIGDARLYDPQKHWFGLALSGFGIVFNHDLLRRLDIAEPRQWVDLCDPRLRSWVALVNPAQSGSITTAFDAILQHRGWEQGWRILRRASANARTFSASAPHAPIDVSFGDAAAGVCIDFLGRYQAQALAGFDGYERVGYVDPVGETSIDSDPISMLRSAPNEETARRFIEFCLTEAGQALWQFRAGAYAADGLGPRRYELRRMPARRAVYERYLDRMIDKANPFEIARAAERPNRETRTFIAPLFAAMAMDNHRLLLAAWNAILAHPAYPTGREIVTAADVDQPTLRRMLELFDAMPSARGPGGMELPLHTGAHLGEIRAAWTDRSLWPAEADPRGLAQVQFSAFFADNYARIIRIANDDD